MPHVPACHCTQVLRSESAAMTARLYGALTRHLAALYAPLTLGHERAEPGECLPTFDEFTARAREQRRRTVRDVWGLMLAAVPRVSGAVADAVVRAYPTPRALQLAYRQAIEEVEEEADTGGGEAGVGGQRGGRVAKAVEAVLHRRHNVHLGYDVTALHSRNIFTAFFGKLN